MIQRIQTLFLIAVVLLAGGLPFFLNLWVQVDGTSVYAENDIWTSSAFYASTALAVLALIRYKNRQQQFVLNRLNILLNLFLLGFFVYRSLNVPREQVVSEKGIGMLIPVFAIVFLVLANKAIQKDEALVKSVDRLR